MKLTQKYFFILFALSLFACGGGGGNSSSPTPTPPTPPSNTAPVANAGADQTVDTNTAVQLDGSSSSDANGDSLVFSWTINTAPSGSNAQLSSASTATPSITPDVDGIYTIQLIVNDGMMNSPVATVDITASTPNTAPVANAGSNQTVDTGAQITLDGSASNDAEGDTITFLWTLTTSPTGSSAALQNSTSESPTLTTDIDGDYVIQLIVNDGQVDSAPATVTVSASTPNVAPVANAGIDQSVDTGDMVTLDGSGSTDANGDNISYLWTITSVPTGSSASLNDTAVSMPEFTADLEGTYVFALVVNDGALDSQTDSVEVVATTLNSAPVANAGADQDIATGTLVTLDGSTSSDVDGDMLTYAWTLSTVPAGSAATLNDASSSSPQFSADLDGEYVADLVVNDGTVDSALDSVTVTASTANSAPTADAGPNQQVSVTDVVTLDGSASTDPNGDAITYSWSILSSPMGSAATLSDASAENPTFTADTEGMYTAQLIVNDGSVDSSADTVNITASVVNAAPVANAGADQRTTTSNVVTLDGSGSSDANGDMLSYQWTFVSMPMGSTATLSDSQAVDPSFTVDLEGSYVLSLVVSDGMEASAADSVQVLVNDTVVQLVRNVGTREDDFNPVEFPYDVNSALNVNTNTNVSSFNLNTFKITPQGGNLTVTNIVVLNETNAIVPTLTGLSEGQVLLDGVEVTFRLASPLTSGETIDLVYGFEIAESGDIFRAEYRFNSN